MSEVDALVSCTGAVVRSWYRWQDVPQVPQAPACGVFVDGATAADNDLASPAANGPAWVKVSTSAPHPGAVDDDNDEHDSAVPGPPGGRNGQVQRYVALHGDRAAGASADGPGVRRWVFQIETTRRDTTVARMEKKREKKRK